MKNKAILFIAYFLLLSCKKDNGSTLNNCPPNSTCTDNYYEGAELVNAHQLGPGNFRVFRYQNVVSDTCRATSELYFETPLSDSEFDITSSQIIAGQNAANNVVAYSNTSPCWPFTAITYVTGGEIKGKRTDATHWLVNAVVTFNTPGDTLKVNQYFTLGEQP